MTRLKYTRKHLSYIRANCARLSRKELTEQFNAKFDMDITESVMHSIFNNHRINSGRTGRFEKGHTPWNKGTKGQGLTGPNKYSFKKGSVPRNIKPLWSERIDRKDGYILMKVPEKDPHTGHKTRYKAKHIWNWEQVNGPVPKGHKIFFIDGDKMNCNPDNLICVSNAECLQLNIHGFTKAPAKLKSSILMLSKVEVKTFERIRGINSRA